MKIINYILQITDYLSLSISKYIKFLYFKIEYLKLGNGERRIIHPRHGFTLVETIVSLGILMLGVGAALTLITTTISHAKQTENMIVVVNLTREGIEVVRAIRDERGYSNIPDGNTAWVVDHTSTTLTTQAVFSGGVDVHACTNCDLFLNNNQYTSISGIATPYRRLIAINTQSSDEKEIISTVRWTEHGRVHTYQLTTVLTNWK